MKKKGKRGPRDLGTKQVLTWQMGWGLRLCISNKFPVMYVLLVCGPQFE